MLTRRQLSAVLGVLGSDEFQQQVQCFVSMNAKEFKDGSAEERGSVCSQYAQAYTRSMPRVKAKLV